MLKKNGRIIYPAIVQLNKGIKGQEKARGGVAFTLCHSQSSETCIAFK